jgi:hypothetical protein
MIERFSSSFSKGILKACFGLKSPDDFKPVFNVSISHGKVPVITSDTFYRIQLMNWVIAL